LWEESLREERDQLEESLRQVKNQFEEKIEDMREEVRGLEQKVNMLENELEQERSKQIGERATPSGVKKLLNKGYLQNLKTFVQSEMFERLKTVNEETLHNHPQIMDEVWSKIHITDETEKVEYRDDVVKEMKRDFSHRRSYCRKLIMGKYKSKQQECNDEQTVGNAQKLTPASLMIVLTYHRMASTRYQKQQNLQE
jgi:hypothetical protein